MPKFRPNPYGAFNFQIAFDGNEDGEPIGGFSDVSGLSMELNYSEYRNGNEKVNTVRKIPNTFKNDEVTLKRGLVAATQLFEWFKKVREGHLDPRSVVVILFDEARVEVARWKLINAQPKKWVGPTLAAKGGGEVAMEEFHLVHEGIDFE